MPLLKILLEILAPILRSKDGRYLLVIAALLLCVVVLVRKTRVQAVALAEKPKVELKEVVKTVEKKIAGPVRVVEKIVVKSGGERIVERVIYRDGVTTEKGSETATEKSEEAACPGQASKRWLAGVVIDPSKGPLNGARLGLTLFDRVDIAGGYIFNGRKQGLLADVTLRF